jgi:hypothetical protein
VPVSFLETRTKNSTACCLPLVQTSSEAVIFTPGSPDIKGLQLNHTRSMSHSDLDIQFDQASVVLSVLQQKLPDTVLTFLNVLRMFTFPICFERRWRNNELIRPPRKGWWM